MEDTSSTKEVTLQGTPVYNPWSFHEVIRAILRCLGLETEFHQNPSSPKKEDDGKVNNNQPGYQEEAADPPSTVTDPAAADPPSTTGDDDHGLDASLSAPERPGTSGGSGPQIN